MINRFYFHFKKKTNNILGSINDKRAVGVNRAKLLEQEILKWDQNGMRWGWEGVCVANSKLVIGISLALCRVNDQGHFIGGLDCRRLFLFLLLLFLLLSQTIFFFNPCELKSWWRCAVEREEKYVEFFSEFQIKYYNNNK